jgi:hypothetical protein
MGASISIDCAACGFDTPTSYLRVLVRHLNVHCAAAADSLLQKVETVLNMLNQVFELICAP